MSERMGLLEVFHPDGTTRRAEVLGSACPARIRPLPGNLHAPLDLLVLAPSSPEVRSREWLAEATRLTSAVDGDGVVYLLAAPRARSFLLRRMAEDFVPSGVLLHLPNPASSELLLVLGRRSVGTAAERLLPPHSARRAAVRLGLKMPGVVAGLGRVHPSAGIVLRRRAGRPASAWLSLTAPNDLASRIVMIQSRWRLDRATAAVHLLPANRAGASVVKIVLRGGDPLALLGGEARALSALGEQARAAGVAVPSSEMVSLGSTHPALRLSLVTGVAAARILADQPRRYDAILQRLAAWLEAWSRATARTRALDRATLDSWVLQPAARMSELLEDGEGYLAWLRSRCLALVGCHAPVVANHRDLTMANVLVDGDGCLGVIDWESAVVEGPPLRDFLYAAVDATAARDRYRDREGAFDYCFGPGRGAGQVTRLLERLRQAVLLPEGYATIAFHSCWLQHAQDERRKRAPGEGRPFLTFLQRAAARRLEL